MDKFLHRYDKLGKLIEENAVILFNRLQQVNADDLGLPGYCLQYFKSSHSKRLFFSIETSAHLLYNSITLKGKSPEELIIMDYGAGVGTLYLLAKMIGCKQLIYNDHMEDWRLSAELIAKAIHVSIDLYIIGDINDCLDHLNSSGIKCDIIVSRNVIEHIYKLDEFYSSIFEKQPLALIYSSTTANKINPVSAIKHVLWHKKWERVYCQKRLAIIRDKAPNLTTDQITRLAKLTQGLAKRELTHSIEMFLITGQLPNPLIYHSNTCDPENGVWAENLLSLTEYRSIIDERKFNVSFVPGFWDTHYRISWKNKFTGLLNRVIRKSGKSAIWLAPFIYVVAQPRVTK